MKILPSLALLVLCLPVATRGQVAPKNTASPAGAARASRAKAGHQEVVQTGMRTFSMYNGMKVTLIHSGTERKAVVALTLGTGQIDEPEFGPGLATLTAAVLLEGTIARSSTQITKEASSFGSGIDANVGAVSTSLSGEVGTEHIARFVSLLSDVVRHPRLDTSGFEKVRRRSLMVLDTTTQDPGHRARQQWRALVFPNHPFGRPYTYPSTLTALQLGHVRNIYDDNFGAARAHLYVSGVFEDAAVERAVRDAFSDWNTGAPAVSHSSSPVSRRQVSLVDAAGAAQSTIWVGLPVIDPSNTDFVKLEIANALLGGPVSSRAVIALGDEERPPAASSSTLWRRKGASYWLNVAQVPGDSTGVALDLLFAQIDRLRQAPPAESDLARVKQDVIDRFNALRGSRLGMVEEMMYVDEFGLGELWLTDYVKQLMAVSAEDVRQTAVSQLDPERMTITVVGDRARVEPLVARFRPALLAHIAHIQGAGHEINQRLLALADSGFSGGVLVERNDSLLLEAGYGFANREREIPFTSTTIAQVGSITKQFTAIAVVDLAERGMLHFSDSVASFFPNVPAQAAHITIGQLLSHTSGLPEACGDDFLRMTKTELIGRCLNQPMPRQSDTLFLYSNLGYSVLGAIVEQVAKQHLEDYLRDRFFFPLGMERTGYFFPRVSEDSLAIGYLNNVPQGNILTRILPMDSSFWNLKGNGAMQSTLADMYRWYRALTNDSRISAFARQALFSPHAHRDTDVYYGYGWFVRTDSLGRTTQVGHSGSDGTFVSLWYWRPLDHLFIYTVANSGQNALSSGLVATIRKAMNAER